MHLFTDWLQEAQLHVDDWWSEHIHQCAHIITCRTRGICIEQKKIGCWNDNMALLRLAIS